MKAITFRNCNVNNLKNISVSIPKNQFTVITGVSGSGKSSLAFDVIYTEGRQAYLQAVGVLPNVQRNAQIGDITGISPAVAVKQSIIRETNPRSLVGTRSGLFDRLRNLMLMEGITATSSSDDIPKLSTEDLNFNSLKGMCLDCKGLGQVREINIRKVIPNHNVTIKNIVDEYYTWTKKDGPNVFLEYYKLSEQSTYQELTERQKDDFLYGFYDLSSGRYGGLIPYIKWRAGHAEKGDNKKSQHYSKTLIENVTCKSCLGYRCRQEALEITLNGLHLGQYGNMTMYELRDNLLLIKQQCKNANGTEVRYPKLALVEVYALLSSIQHFMDVELGHLTLYRELRTLSGGEMQRFQLMTYLQAETDSLVYVFDEPTLGLHELEKQKIINKLIHLKELGNTIIVVDHDKSVIEAAEYVIDVGPGAGREGGEVIYEGNLAGLLKCTRSVTGVYLSGKHPLHSKSAYEYREIDEHSPSLSMEHVTIHNLNDVKVSIPLGIMVGIAGVSGSGKSSLISSALLPALRRHFKIAIDDELENDIVETVDEVITTVISGVEHLSGYAAVTQEPIGRNKRSTPVTYLNIWDDIRKLYANQPSAIKEGLSAEYFSFNSAGACPVCQGMGNNERSLGIMGSIIGPCHECEGSRFHSDVLAVQYKGKNIAEVLNMEVKEAIEHFSEVIKVHEMLHLLERTGMGYITLGQPTSTLSGGEAQRIKLAKELGLARKGNVLYVLDEPTAGLSLHDTSKLLSLLHELIDNGNSIIVIEHDPSVLSSCDWLIELGPGGANHGGQIIAQGTPQQLRENTNSIISPYL